MNLVDAHAILAAFGDGVDPFTGEVLGPDCPLQHPDGVRAIHAVLRELDARSASALKRERPPRLGPPNAGTPWSDRDTEQLLAGHEAGATTKDLAARFGRSELAITSRLVKFGRLPATDIKGLLPNAVPSGAPEPG